MKDGEQIMKNRRSCCLLLLAAGVITGLLLIFSTEAVSAKTTKGRTLKVAFPELEGISETDANGKHTGFFVDYLNEIAKYTDWKYEYIPVDNESLISNFMEGRYDLMGGAFYSPAFEEFFAYPDYNMGRSRAVLMCRRDDESLKSYDLATLNGKTIGVFEKATDKIRHLNEFLDSNELDCQLKYYGSEDMGSAGNLYRQLRDKEVDMLLGNDLEGGGEFRMVASFQAQPYYIVTTVGNTELLDELNMAFEHILESTPDFADKAYNANFPDANLTDMQLNDKEEQYIKDKKMLRVAVPENWHPLFCRDTPTEEHKGMLPVLFDRISEFTGLQFTYVFGDNYTESLRMVEEGEADILGVYLSGEEEAFSDGFALSQTYISLSNMVMKHKSVSYPGEGLVCGVKRGRNLPDDFKAKKVIIYDRASEMLEAVNSGEVDYIYGASAMLEQEMQNHRYLNVVPVTQASDSTDVAFAVARPVTPELLTILNKAIGSISAEDRELMLNQNMVSMGYKNLSLQELLYANPVAFILIFGCVLVLVAAGIMLIIKSRMKNTLMQSQLEAAEAKSQAKSEFLSQMSHEMRTPMNAIVGLTDLIDMEQDLPGEAKAKLKKIQRSSQYLLSLINDILDMSKIENRKMKIEKENFYLPVLMDDLQEMMSIQSEKKGLRFQAFCSIKHEYLMGDAIRLRQVLTNLLSNAIKFTSPGGEITLCAEETACDGKEAEFHFSVKDTGVGIPPEAQERIFTAFEQLEPLTSRNAGTGLGLPISRNLVQMMGGDIHVISEPGKGSEFYLNLRFPLGTEEKSPDEENWNLEGLKVLLAEDNDLNAEIASELLAIQKIEVNRVADGQEAVDMFKASAPGEYQAVIMDIRMPIKDGYEAAREIRDSQRPDAGVPIIAMTANSFREDEEEAMRAGMDAFVPKPVEPGRLFSALQELCR